MSRFCQISMLKSAKRLDPKTKIRTLNATASDGGANHMMAHRNRMRWTIH